MIKLKYFALQLRRTLKVAPLVLLFTVVIGFFLFMMCKNLFASDSTEEIITDKFKVGITGDLENEYISLALNTIGGVDASGDYLEFVLIDNKDEAIKAVERGEIIGFVNVSEEFMKNAMRGQNVPIEYYAKHSSIDLSTALVNEVVSTISELLVGSQAGIFTINQAHTDAKGKNPSWGFSNSVSIRYGLEVTLRDDFVEVTELGSHGEPTFKGYYICGFIVLLILLVGVLCANHLIKTDCALSRMLSSRGCTSVWQVLCELASYVILPIVLLFVFFITAGFIINGRTIGVPELNNLNAYDMLLLFIKCIPAFLCVCSMQYFIYELCSNIIAGTLLQFTCSVGLAYISGCLYPISFFPDVIKKIAPYLPVGACFNSIKSAFTDAYSFEYFVVCLIFTLLFFVLSAFVRHIKLRSRLS